MLIIQNAQYLHSIYSTDYLDEEGTKLLTQRVKEYYMSEVLHLYASSSIARHEFCFSNHCFS